MTVARETPSVCSHCGGDSLEQDPDVLDTWFSSALWPFSTLGWPDKTLALKRFYPTQDLETGYDILFFWVARMIMMGLHFMGEVPFSRVLLAGLVTDEHGDKMSKVKGNVVDPLDVIYGATLDALIAKAEKSGAKKSGINYLKKTYPEGFAAYGADALRMTLLSYSPQSRRIALSIKRIEGYRNFANKLWNAARYALMKLEGRDAVATQKAPEATALANRWILQRLGTTITACREGIESYRLDDASQALYHFVWDEFCDWYLEWSKPLLESTDPSIVNETANTLVHVLETILRALHPMMPHLTEEIWQRVPKTSAAEASIMISRYPDPAIDGRIDSSAEAAFETFQEFVSSIRKIRAEHDLPWAKKVDAYWYCGDETRARTLLNESSNIFAMAGCTLHREPSNARVDDAAAHFSDAAVFVVQDLIAVVPDVVDREKERDRLTRQLGKIDKELSTIEKKLANASFVDRAPPDVVQKTREQSEELSMQQTQLRAALQRLNAG
ncbi:MAG: class I tRNA ligase family protein [Polyangiales bacterium]